MTASNPAPLAADEALARLLAGNARFASGAPEHPRQSTAHRRDLRTGQRPFAAVVGCADSRVPPEIVFDQGLGDLFVLRVAGNVLDDALLGSLEYATSHLGTPLVVILGHSRCGAMGAALAGGELPGRLPAIVDVLRPSVEAARRLPGDPLAHAARAHARAMAERVRRAEPVLAGRVAAGATRVIAAYYDIETGAVEVLE